MSVFYNDLMDRLSELHAEIGKSLDGLTSDALDWVPGPEMNSITVLVTHLTGAEQYWIGVAINKPPERNRAAEFLTKGLDCEELNSRVASAEKFAQQALASLSIKDLETNRQSPRNKKTFTVGWCLAHALEHSAIHTGHIQLTRQLWDLRKGVP
ncbi:MAG: DinB family protein [Anaerolineales bacterium]